MRKTIFTISVIIVALLLNIAVPASLHAQTTADDSIYNLNEVDSAQYPPAVTDSVTSNYDTSYEASGEDQSETLYFIRKDDTTSLFDSSVIEWRIVPDSVVRSIKKDGAFWYADKDMEKKSEESEKFSWFEKIILGLINLLAHPVFRKILWTIIIGGFAAAVIWFLVQNQMNIFGSGKKSVVVRKTEAEVTEDVFSADLEKAANAAAAQGNFRQAIRFQYLQLLKIFSQYDLLQYRQDATNYDYLKQLYDRPYYRDFFRATRNYEYAWYGEMEVSKEQYDIVHKEINNLIQKAAVNR